jgi:hypothetical protein
MMLYHDISLVSVLGLRGTLRIQEAENAGEVSVQTDGPYETKVADGGWLIIYPEGQEPSIPARVDGNEPITAGRTHLGSVDVTAQARFLTDPVPRARTRASIRIKATVRITAPPGTRFELIGCQGVRKGPGGHSHLMRGKSRFDIRRRR